MFNFTSRCEDFLLDETTFNVLNPRKAERRGVSVRTLGAIGDGKRSGRMVRVFLRWNGLNSECGGGDGERQRWGGGGDEEKKGHS